MSNYAASITLQTLSRVCKELGDSLPVRTVLTFLVISEEEELGRDYMIPMVDVRNRMNILNPDQTSAMFANDTGLLSDRSRGKHMPPLGLISIHGDPTDGRRRMIKITDKGRKVLMEVDR